MRRERADKIQCRFNAFMGKEIGAERLQVGSESGSGDGPNAI